MNFDLTRRFMDRLTAEKVPGNAITVYYRGQKVFEYASGYADLENRIPMTGQELLNIYSCSKVTTVTAGAQLVERGILHLNDPLYEYIPEYRHMKVRTPGGELADAQNPITVGDLFTMTAGFDYDLNNPAVQKVRAESHGEMDTLAVVRAMAELPLWYEPGTKWMYSLAHDVLAGLVSAVTGQKFRDYVQANIFAPLEIRDAFYHHTPEIEARMAQQYRLTPKDAVGEFDPAEAQKNGKYKNGLMVNVGKGVAYTFGPEYDSGGAGITVSVPEYAKLAAALANQGLGLTGERILSAHTVQLMKQDRLTADTRPYFNWTQFKGYGYGMGVRTLISPAAAGSLSSVGEFGWAGAAGGLLLADTELNLAVFYAHHMLNPQEPYYFPRLRNTVYASLDA